MTNTTSGINTEIKVNAQKLETLTSFKYLGSVITDEGSKPEMLYRRAQTTAVLTRLKPVWNDRRNFLSVPRYDWCAPLSHPSSCMLVNHGPSQQSSKKSTSRLNEVLPQDTTHLIQRPCYQRGSLCQGPASNRITWRPSDHRKETQTAVVVSRSSGLAKTILQGSVLKGQEDKADGKRGGKTTSRNGQAWSLLSPSGQKITGKNGGNWLWRHLWCPNVPRG